MSGVLLAATWWTGCHGPDRPGPPRPDGGDVHSAAPTGSTGAEPHSGGPRPTVRELATAEGWTVGDGVFTTGDLEDCCAPGVSCLWNNPSTPYVTVALPPAPDQAQPDFGTDADGRSRTFHLRADEAVVMLGPTPPAAAYFSVQTYLQYRPTAFGVKSVLGATGPSTNHLTVAASRGGPAWDVPVARVTTADAAVERRVVGWLVAAGWDAADIVVDHVPPDLVRLGVGAGDDSLGVVSRVAVFEDAARGEAWLAAPGWEVLRLTPPGPAADAVEPQPRDPVPRRGSGSDEEAWRPSVDALEAAVLAAWPGEVAVPQESRPFDFEVYDCVTEPGGCSGNTQDRYYAKVPRFYLPGDGSFLVAFGVNHGRVGKASYSNVSVNSIEGQIGLASLDTPELVGSARPFLGGDPRVDDLYVAVVARDCAPFAPTPCLTVPTGCPGVELEDPMMVDFRAYLEPATGAAPLGSELVVDRAIHFSPP